MKTFLSYINEVKEQEIVIDKHNTVINHYQFDKGDKVWLKDGKFHRENGPALEHPNGYKEWWINGKLHRLNGPAIEHSNGTKEWYINDNPVSEWTEQEIKLLIANNNLKNIIKYPEVREKIKEFQYLLNPKDKVLLDLEWKKKL